MAHAVEEDVSQRECLLVHRNRMKEQAEVRNVKLKCNRKGPLRHTGHFPCDCKLQTQEHKSQNIQKCKNTGNKTEVELEVVIRTSDSTIQSFFRGLRSNI